MAGGFASIHVGLGSPKLEFGRDWSGASRREKSVGPETARGGESASAQTTERSAPSLSSERPKEKRDSGLVDRVSGLPSPPGTESDIALPAGKSSNTSSAAASQTRTTSSSPEKNTSPYQQSPQRPSISTRRGSVTSPPPHPLSSRRISSQSGSSATRTPDSSRLHANAMKLKGDASMSRTSSATSVVTASPIQEQKRSEIGGGGAGRSRGSPPSDLSRRSSQWSSASLGESRGSSPRRRGLAPLDLHNSSSSRASSPEETSRKLPPLSSSLEKDEERPSRRLSNVLRREPLDEDDRRERTHTRRKSQGEILDDKIREAEEKIMQSRNGRNRRSLDVERAEPVTGSIQRHDSYSRALGPGGPVSSTLRRSATLSSASVSVPNGDAIRRRVEGSYKEEEEGEPRKGSGERSGGSGSGSSRRKALPTDFRNGSFFTPSPKTNQTNQGPGDAPPLSARSTHLRQAIDSPSQYHSPSPLPSRLSTTSRLGRDYDGSVPSPSRPSSSGRIDGLERSSIIAGMRRGETSEYSHRNWSQSISGLPKAADPEMLGRRDLPKDRYRPDSALERAGDRTRYQARSTADPALTERELSRRGLSMLVSERDLVNASTRSRITSIAPGDSISAVGAKSDREGSKDPLDVIRRLEEQRAQSKRRWDHIPRSSSSMSSMRDIYQNPPRTAPAESMLPTRRSMDKDTLVSPSYGRGGGSRLSLRPMTEPKHKRSLTSLGGRSSASLDQPQSPSTEHGRLLFEAFRALENKLAREGQATPDLLGAFSSAARTSETVNSTLGAAFKLAKQISLEAAVEDDTAKAREGYMALVMLLSEAGKASDQNMRDMTRVMLDLPKILRQSGTMEPLTPSSSVRLRRSESLATPSAFDRIRANRMSEERARRWQPSAASMYDGEGADHSPFQKRYSVDTPRRSFDVARASTSIGESFSPSPRPPRERSGSTVSSLVSKVRSMGLTPRKGTLSPKMDLSTIEQSPPQPQMPQMPKNLSVLPTSKSRSSLSLSSHSVSPEKPQISSSLKKMPSSTSSYTVRGSSFLPKGSHSKATTAVSQVTAGDRSPPMSIRSGRTLDMENESNSPVSQSSFLSRRETARSEDEWEGERYGLSESGGSYRAFEGNAISVLERNLVDAAKAREEGEVGWSGKGKATEVEVERERGSGTDEGKGRKMAERLRASWMRNSSRPAGVS